MFIPQLSAKRYSLVVLVIALVVSPFGAEKASGQLIVTEITFTVTPCGAITPIIYATGGGAVGGVAPRYDPGSDLGDLRIHFCGRIER